MLYKSPPLAGNMHEHDTLSLLALKVAPNVFDLSSGQQHVSIRDQVTRAQMLVRDLCAADPDAKHILVVGAGIAGVAAAFEAAARGKTVVIVDTAAQPFSLQRNAPQRFVGPFMYEWPSSFFDNQSYPPRNDCHWGKASLITPAWSGKQPLSGTALAGQLDEWLLWAESHPDEIRKEFPKWTPPGWWFNATAASVTVAVKRFASQTGEAIHARTNRLPLVPTVDKCEIDVDKNGEYMRLQFKAHYILLGAGLGQENVALPDFVPFFGPSEKVVGVPFWGTDTLLDPQTADQKTGVFGGGDGAMQDALRALTGLGHPLEMMARLEKNAAVSKLLLKAKEQLLAMEQQSRLVATWALGHGPYGELDRACGALAVSLCKKPAMRRVLLGCLREGDGAVFQFVRENHFGKAYLLNRFLMHLLIACRSRASKAEWGGRMDYECHFGAEASQSLQAVGPHSYRTEVKALPHYMRATGGRAFMGGSAIYDFHQAAVRFGVVQGTTPGSQMVTLTGLGRTIRTSLARVPVPFVLPKQA
jgi:hypothetical protein